MAPDVRYQGAGSSGIAGDSSRRRRRGSLQLWDDLGGEELQVGEIGHVQKLKVDPLDADRRVPTELVGDLGRWAHQG